MDIRSAFAVPSVTSQVIFKRIYSDQPNETPEPRATSVSMFGARCARDLNPEVKNARLIIITIIARSIWMTARPIWLCTRKKGTGHPHILCPIVIYIRTRRKPTESTSRLTSFGVSLSFRASSSAASFALALSFLTASSLGEAP